MGVVCLGFGLMCFVFRFFLFKQKTAYEMRISDWSSDVCSSDLAAHGLAVAVEHTLHPAYWYLCVLAGGVVDDLHRCRFALPPVFGESRADFEDHIFALLAYCRRYIRRRRSYQIGRASCRERVCQYV